MSSALAIAVKLALAAPCSELRFEPWLTFDDHDLVHAIEVADLDADGRLDLLVSESNYDFVSVYFGASGGTFRRLCRGPAGTQPYPMAVADFDRDGRLDVATGNGNGGAALLFGTADGGLSAPTLVAGAAPAATTGL